MRSSLGIVDNLIAQARIRSLQEYCHGHSYRAWRSGVRHALEALNGSAHGDAHVGAFHRASASIKHGKWTVRNTINML